MGSEGLVIDTARYKLASDVRAFGLRSDFGHRSSAMPYSKTDLALYLRDGNTLRPVLEGLVVAKGRTYAEPSISANQLTTDLQT
ncbi:PA3715 family protein [Pseudomonas sp. MDT1-16]